MPKAKPEVVTEEFSHKDLRTADKVARRLAGLPLTGRTKKTDELVSAKELCGDDEERLEEAINVLASGHQIKMAMAELNDGLDEAKMIATSICVGADIPGFRYDNMAVTVSLQTRNTFSKDRLIELLVDAGVDPIIVGQAVKEAHTTGDPFYVVKFEKV